MERKLRINWHALVEEARRRRKAQKFTQQRLAALADVSTPTVSRFEGGEKNIQLSSALAILDVLGMVQAARIDFPDKIERYDNDRDVVLFLAHTDAGEVTCAISGEALDDHFHARNGSERARLAAFRAHRSSIEAAAREKYFSGRPRPDGPMILDGEDVQAALSMH